jgi:hypothetical protein
MTKSELANIVEYAACKVIGWEDAGNAGHRLVLGRLIQAFNNSESALLCEPSLARKTRRPPDVVLIDPEIGVHVFEVKAITLEQIERIEGGGVLHIRYANRVDRANPIVQVRNAMFDIKDATARAFGGDVALPFKYWAVFPLIRQAGWIGRFGEVAYRPPEYLFADSIGGEQLARQLGASQRFGSTQPIHVCSLEQLNHVWRAFGDTSVLYCSPRERQPRQAGRQTLGGKFDEAAEAYKELSADQQRLSMMNWEGGPRQIRGVAGSGKTIVLAINLARCLERKLADAGEGLFGAQPSRPRILAVCFNRTLAPFLRKKINIAFQQRNDRPVPDDTVDVCCFNSLMYTLARAGVWRYQNVGSVEEMARALTYLDQLQDFRQRNPERLIELGYDAIYVDEGQDFVEEEFRLLKELCRTKENAEPNLYVFYDDAQNLFARERPNWQSLGLNVVGRRSFVMTQCFRNTRPIVEAAFNVLYGTCAAAPTSVPTRRFGDIGSLEQKHLIEDDGGFWRIKFASRDGVKPRLSVVDGLKMENQAIVARLRWLIEEQQVRPQDILVLTFEGSRVTRLVEAVQGARIPGVAAVHNATNKDDKDQPLCQPDRLTISTVASAKGYDAYCVLLASANEFKTDLKGRANFYVGCTRAIEYLEVFAYERKYLAVEFEAALARTHGG